MKATLPLLTVVLLAGASSESGQQRSKPIDERSYQLGVIGAFAEVVGAGVKKLALSSPLTPSEMDALIDDAEKIVARNKALSYREGDFLVTDLFPSSETEGKQVLLIYLRPVKDEYLALKKEKAELIAQGRYEGDARLQIARKFGKLLSYPDWKIDELLKAR